MRQSHQKSRSRGRNRKPQNPMSRNYESNGPDVKIRGNAGHIAEKYSTLARDALSNGDTVMAENYYQHAEHYNRLIAAAQAQRAEENAANVAANGRGPQPDVAGETPDASQEQDANASEGSDGEEATDAPEQPKERKSSRGRRTKRVAAETPSQSEDEVQTEAADGNGVEADSVSGSEEISDDAASLPQSITGGLRVEEA